MWQAILALIFLVVVAIYRFYKTINRKRFENEPPLVPGHPIFGNGEQFRQNAVQFLLDCANKYGPIFTIRLLHHHVTIVMDPHAYPALSEEAHFDFKPIRKQVNLSIFQFEAIDSHLLIRDAAKTVRGDALNHTMVIFSQQVSRAIHSHIAKMITTSTSNTTTTKTTTTTTTTTDGKTSPKQTECSVELDKLAQSESESKTETESKTEAETKAASECKSERACECECEYKWEWQYNGLKVALTDTLFEAMLVTLFGQQAPDSQFTATNMGRNLEQFHKYFNYLWLGLPMQMFPEAQRLYNEMLQWQPSAQQLLESASVSPYVRASTQFMLRNGQSEHSIKCHHTVFTHVNHNTFRATFWAIYHVLSNAEARAALQDEVDSFVQAKNIDNKVQVSTRELNALPILDSVVKETLRHASGVFVMRAVVEDTLFKLSKDSDKQYYIRKGDKVAYYPPAIHHDAEIFDEPYKFVYDRFVERTFYKHGKPLRTPVQPFGSVCPGVQFAQLQTKWFLLAWFAQLHAELLPNQSTDYNLNNYGNEIVPEVHDVQIRYRLKQTPELSLV